MGGKDGFQQIDANGRFSNIPLLSHNGFAEMARASCYQYFHGLFGLTVGS
tara:strand:- start:1422 stop:1571 length:150 start_codon:yes stop_codon:yes gene_type:complete